MKQFEPGKSYFCRSACDHDCVWYFHVVSRTAATITVLHDGDTMRLRIAKDSPRWGYEYAMPFGRYSMAPSISADRPVEAMSSY